MTGQYERLNFLSPLVKSDRAFRLATVSSPSRSTSTARISK